MESVFVKDSKTSRSVIRKNIISKNLIPYVCSFCKNKGEWFGKELSLHLDHINGVNNDNRIENLRFLCPNCHATTSTYVGKNKFSSKSQISEEEVIKALKETINVSRACVKLGLSPYGASHNRVSKIKDKHSIVQKKSNLGSKKYCKDCGVVVSFESVRCVSCNNLSQRKTERPSKEVLFALLDKFPYTTVSSMLGVSDNAVRKWVRIYQRSNS